MGGLPISLAYSARKDGRQARCRGGLGFLTELGVRGFEAPNKVPSSRGFESALHGGKPRFLRDFHVKPGYLARWDEKLV